MIFILTGKNKMNHFRVISLFHLSLYVSKQLIPLLKESVITEGYTYYEDYYFDKILLFDMLRMFYSGRTCRFQYRVYDGPPGSGPVIFDLFINRSVKTMAPVLI